MKKFSLLFILLLMSFVPLQGVMAAVWKAENEWNDAWENRYRQWVVNNWTDDFFMNPAKPTYYRYEHDCADASYAMRLVFAYEHKLPFVVNHPHRRGGLITNNMTTWNNLPEAQRVRKFLDYVATNTDTRTLRHDTFPIALADIKPGDIYVAPGVHSYQIVEVTETGIAEVMASTSPKTARYMLRTPSFPFYVPEDRNMKDGYRRFKQPQNIQRPARVQPGYSEEQFRLAADVNHDYVAFTDIIARKLGKRPERPDEKTQRLLLALCMYANDRSVYVYDALWHLQQIRQAGRQCMNRREYDDHSTPGRDRRLKMFFDSVKRHIDTIGRFDPNSHPARWAKAVFAIDEPPPGELQHLNNFCMVQLTLGEELYMSLRELRQNLEGGHLVSDPHAPLQYRWGIAKTPFRANCPTY